jgi:SAM-dependent methyltransferase
MTAGRVRESRFWNGLWRHYFGAPSVALCRVPELEYASTLPLEGRALDHCCGDGYFASLAWPGARFAAGCDLNAASIAAARRFGRHERLDVCDAAHRLPYDDGAFDLVFNNSALEHIPDLGASLREVARVTRPGGVFAFNVLNTRYFDWWPLDESARDGYRQWQPFIHALSLSDWRARLDAVGFAVEDVKGYFDERASRTLALLDCEFSGHLLRQIPSDLVRRYNGWFGLRRAGWKRRIGAMDWPTAPDEGAGYFMVARRA